MTNPTPVAWIDKDCKAFHWHHQVGNTVELLSTDVPLFTEAQLNQARADALREAAGQMEQMVLDGETSISEASFGVQELRRMRELASTTLRGIKVDKDKTSRAMPWAARAEAGAVRIVAGSWVKDFIDEVVAFPSAPHDDYVDAASGAVAMVARPKIDWGFS